MKGRGKRESRVERLVRYNLPTTPSNWPFFFRAVRGGDRDLPGRPLRKGGPILSFECTLCTACFFSEKKVLTVRWVKKKSARTEGGGMAVSQESNSSERQV